MTYWIVIGLAFLALAGVFLVGISGTAERQESVERSRRPIWLLLGSSGRPPSDGSQAPDWAELLADRFPSSIEAIDLTRNGCTAAELQREQLRKARGSRPSLAVMLLGPDDFRDALPRAEFERRYRYIAETLASAGARIVAPLLPPLVSLPSLRDDNPNETEQDEIAWNEIIGEVIEAVGGTPIRLVLPDGATPVDLFTERDSRFILTNAGHEWLASTFFAALQPFAAPLQGGR
jgi:hypothetical protein